MSTHELKSVGEIGESRARHITGTGFRRNWKG
jgi:hypothetical protein